jgi:topoisomerase-4 subunit A
VRARWHVEDQGRGTYQIVVTEIPLSGAEVAADREDRRTADRTRSCRCSSDVRDESAEDIRVVLEPKSRTVDPDVLMESLFKLTELESRIPLNMNVLSRRQGAAVMA